MGYDLYNSEEAKKERAKILNDEAKQFSDKYFNNEMSNLTARAKARLAAASINILSTTPIYRDNDVCGYVFNYEYQWKSRGNYIWSKDSFIAEDCYLYLNSNFLYNDVILDRVKRIRDVLEDPGDRGKYTYLENEKER